MKILLICHRVPFPPNRGGKIRAFNMVRHLSQNHSVVVASLAHTEQERVESAGLAKYCEQLIVEVLPDSSRWLNACKALATSTPSSVASFWSRGLATKLNELLEQTRFDVVLVHCAFVAQYALQCTDGLRVLDYGDIDSVKWAEYAKWKGFPLSHGYALEAKKLRAYERDIAAHFHQCTVTTEVEKEEFENLGTAKPCTVVPNGVDTTYFTRNGNSGGNAIIFLGRMHYFPNVDGVCYFAQEVFPLVRREMPDAEFRIIGSNPSARVRNLARVPGVTVTGHVADIRSHVRDAGVSVAPLRIARGTQNKILESMAMAIPVVATPQAAKGVDVVPGRDLLVASDPGAFAEHVVRVLRSDSLRRRLVMSSRAQIEKSHLWPKSMTVLEGLLKSQLAFCEA